MDETIQVDTTELMLITRHYIHACMKEYRPLTIKEIGRIGQLCMSDWQNIENSWIRYREHQARLEQEARERRAAK